MGSNKLVGTDPKRIVEFALEMAIKKRNWVNPFGDGRSAQRIVEILRQKFE